MRLGFMGRSSRNGLVARTIYEDRVIARIPPERWQRRLSSESRLAVFGCPTSLAWFPFRASRHGTGMRASATVLESGGFCSWQPNVARRAARGGDQREREVRRAHSWYKSARLPPFASKVAERLVRDAFGTCALEAGATGWFQSPKSARTPRGNRARECETRAPSPVDIIEDVPDSTVEAKL